MSVLKVHKSLCQSLIHVPTINKVLNLKFEIKQNKKKIIKINKQDLIKNKIKIKTMKQNKQNPFDKSQKQRQKLMLVFVQTLS